MEDYANPLPPELAKFTVQEIQLEMIRRAGGNFDPDEIVEFLLEHQDLWVAAILYRVSTHPHPATPLIQLPQLFHLRELLDDFWSSDTLYVLTNDQAQIEKLLELWPEDGPGGMTDYFSKEQIDLMLPTMRGENCRILKVWWD